MSKLKNTITLSGGLSYHIKAYLYQKNWQPLKNALSSFLESWSAKHKKLTVIGPSGGYTLNTNLLNKYEQVNCYDIDPLAYYFFKKNHKQTISWHKQDFFSAPPNKNSNLLFSNLLGQITASIIPDDLNSHYKSLKERLNNSCWASYHDVYSWDTEDQKTNKINTPQNGQCLDEYLKQILKPESEVIDHKTQILSSWADQSCYFLWPLTPKRMHLIECCYKD